jgi:murein DD-endopeptidase MepM/ murein hydrolase activator NlpD
VFTRTRVATADRRPLTADCTRRAVGRGASAVLFALLAFFVCALTPASAGGLVISSGLVGQAGPQIDTVAISPAPRLSTAQTTSPSTYLVQRGDTLSGIAARFGTSVASLASLNGLTNADRIDAGRMLKVGAVTATSPMLPLDSPLTRVQFWPWPPIQGQTLSIWLHARRPLTPSISFGGEVIPVSGEGLRTWAVIPIPALAAANTQPLTVTVGGARLSFAVPIRAGTFEVQVIPAEASDPILGEVAKVNAEYYRMTALFARRAAGDWTPRSRFGTPLPAGVAYAASSPFGSRRTYGGSSAVTAHAGEDYAVAAGTPVLAPARATVVLAEPLFVRGNAVVLDHGRGVFTGYWHLETIEANVGDQVIGGQVIGAVGSTGLSTGAHLHWEMRVAGVAVDPLQWVEQIANSK